MSVQVALFYKIGWVFSHFNTSYVSVQVRQGDKVLFIDEISIHRMCRFKFSRVARPVKCKLISIHRMCRFKLDSMSFRIVLPLFQYIVCVGSSVVLYVKVAVSKAFQYIVCVGSSYHHLAILSLYS